MKISITFYNHPCCQTNISKLLAQVKNGVDQMAVDGLAMAMAYRTDKRKGDKLMDSFDLLADSTINKIERLVEDAGTNVHEIAAQKTNTTNAIMLVIGVLMIGSMIVGYFVSRWLVGYSPGPSTRSMRSPKRSLKVSSWNGSPTSPNRMNLGRSVGISTTWSIRSRHC
jgi:hypothetical protein